MTYIGDFRLGDTFDTKFCTVGTTGAPTTLAGSPVVSAYVGNSTTELTAGITLTVDFDGRTGMHNVRVVASGGNGYATASNYQLVLTAGTVGGTSVVGYVIAQFSIENRSALMPTTAARTLDVTATGGAGIDWSNVEAPTTTLNLSGTTVKTATDVETDTADIQTRLPAALVSGRMSSDAVAISGSTAAADQVETTVAQTVAIRHAGSVTGSPTTTSFADTAITEGTNFWKGRVLVFTSGSLAGQATGVTASAVGSLTFVALTAAPSVSDTYILIES